MEIKTELSLCSTKDLMAELARRHDALVIAGMKFTTTSGGYSVTRYHQGHRHVCIGMMSNIESLLNQIENSSLGPDDG